MPARPLPTLLVAALVGLGASACSSTEQPSATTVTPDRPVIQPGAPGEASTTHTGPIAIPVEQPTDADVLFVKSMIVHHAQAIEMVDLAEDGLEDRQVVALAERIRAAQGPEVGAMAAWLAEQDELVPPEAADVGVDVEALGGELGARPRGGGHAHATGGQETMAGMASPEQLERLGSARGQEADLLFLELMTAHHEGALDMIDQHGAGGLDVRAREMADEMSVEQTAEIGRMAELRDRILG
ncbi:DUF305 domain-containing protein [Ornithinimicrobium pekingense]|uniref:Lipoprotein n=1 Tax=Ornithinimicrobium pekingense TaxID=384677 RepID=A0ABQ2F337_9MICO|nr:DUF305 domain-containing protein [Ornithinimicrobium pekingense]GGK55929.1 lipoprotein [Ornithinimicrobium pekingense]